MLDTALVVPLKVWLPMVQVRIHSFNTTLPHINQNAAVTFNLVRVVTISVVISSPAKDDERLFFTVKVLILHVLQMTPCLCVRVCVCTYS